MTFEYKGKEKLNVVNAEKLSISHIDCCSMPVQREPNAKPLLFKSMLSHK